MLGSFVRATQSNRMLDFRRADRERERGRKRDSERIKTANVTILT